MALGCKETGCCCTPGGKSRNKAQEILDALNASVDKNAIEINSLKGVNDDPRTELNVVQQWRCEENNMVCVRAAVDSGSLDCVGPPTMAPGVPIKESKGSRKGQQYGSASGHKIPNMGEQNIIGMLENGSEKAMNFQVAEVTRPLLSVGRICDRGNQVLFGQNGGVIMNLKTGEVNNFYRDRDGMYQLDFWIRNPRGETNSGFPRPGM